MFLKNFTQNIFTKFVCSHNVQNFAWMEQNFRWKVAVKFRWKAVAVGGTVAQNFRWMVADRTGTKFRLKGKFLAEGNVIFLYCQKIFLYCQKIALLCQKKLDKKTLDIFKFYYIDIVKILSEKSKVGTGQTHLARSELAKNSTQKARSELVFFVYLFVFFKIIEKRQNFDFLWS